VAEEDVAEEDMEDEATTNKEKRLNKKQRDAEKRRHEREIAEKEEARISNNEPQSAADFERLLLSSPSSSYLWVQYMAFCLSTTEIEKARKIAERATKSVGVTNATSKLDIWIAWLNLEQLYGDDQTFEKVYANAIRYNDDLLVNKKVIEIYANAGATEKLEKLFEKTLKKYKSDEDVWIRYMEYLLSNEQIIKCREILNRALQVLPKPQHVSITSKFGQLEYRIGSVERARSVFEGILINFPKRADIWSVYLDKEMQVGDVAAIRQLLDRITSLKLSSKSMKTFFKRFMSFEKANGDEESVEQVKQKATRYVENS